MCFVVRCEIWVKWKLEDQTSHSFKRCYGGNYVGFGLFTYIILYNFARFASCHFGECLHNHASRSQGLLSTFLLEDVKCDSAIAAEL